MNGWMVAAALNAAVPEVLWVMVYSRRPWRSTPIGWVFLAKGIVLATLLVMLVGEWTFYNFPLWAWGALLYLLGATIWIYFMATVRADRLWKP